MIEFFLGRVTCYGWIPEWPKGTDCKSAANCFGGSNPPPSIRWCGGIGRRKGLKIPRWQHRAGSSPATSSSLWIAETLNISVFPLFFCLLGVRVETCKIFTLVYTLLKVCKIIGCEYLRCVYRINTQILNIKSFLQFLPFLLVRVPGEAVVVYERLYVLVSGKFHSIL